MTSAQSLALHWAAVLRPADRGQHGAEETAAGVAICSDSALWLRLIDGIDWCVAPARHMAPFLNQIIVRKFNLFECSRTR